MAHRTLDHLACGAHGVRSAPAAGFARPGTAPSYAPDLLLEPVHLDLEARVDLDRRRVAGTVAHTVQSRSDEARELVLDAVDLEISEVSAAGALALSWRHDGERLHLRLAEPLPRGETLCITVHFVADDPITGFLFGTVDDDPDAGSHLERSAWAGTDHETQRARYWLPCLDHPAVRTTLDLKIRADSALTVLATGAHQGSTAHDDGSTTHRWVLSEGRCPAYLLCVVVGELVEADLGEAQGVPVRLYAPAPFTAEDLTRAFGDTGELLDWITERLGRPYPYPKYFQWAAPGVGGAMENISLVSWDAAWVLDARTHEERGWLLQLINLHEMAHTWFGDHVVIRDFAHGWLKESWATYMESVFLGSTQGDEAMQWQLHMEATAYMSEADSRYVRPLVTRHYESGWDMFDHHLYPGGAWRLHMLRRQLGETAFWAGVRDYLETYADRAVETDQFRHKLEEHSGRNLDRFFQEWVHSPGYPKLDISQKHVAERGVLELKVRQTQVDAAKGVGTFTLPLEVLVLEADGAERRHRLELDRERQVLVLPAAEPPRAVLIDPDQSALFALDYDPGQDQLEVMLAAEQSLKARLHAAKTLAASGRRRALQAVAARYAAESHWGARVGLAQAVAAAGTRAAARVLCDWLAVEQDPKVLGWLTRAMGELQEPVVAEALRAWLDAGPTLPWAVAGALHSLGRQRDATDLHRLAAAADASPIAEDRWGWVQVGALAGLGELRTAEARAALRERMDQGQPQHRAAAAAALASAAAWAEPGERQAVLEALAAQTRDPETKVRQAAGRAVASLGEPGGAEVLRKLARTLPGQDAPRVERDAEKLERKGGGGSGKRLERLEERLRELQDRLDKVQARVEHGH